MFSLLCFHTSEMEIGMQALPRPAFVGSRYCEPELEHRSHISRYEEFPESWYSQFSAKYKASGSPSFSGDRDKRTPEDMSLYMRLNQNHRKRRLPFLDDQPLGSVSSAESGTNMHPVDEETSLFPEIMFIHNSVPDSALSLFTRAEDNQRFEFKGVFETLPNVVTRNSLMIEKLGIRPEYLNTEQGRYQYQGRTGSEAKRTNLSEAQASQISQKVSAIMLRSTGFESATQLPVETISQLLSCHISKLGGILKVLADNYRKQCSALELIKMFLQSAKHM